MVVGGESAEASDDGFDQLADEVVGERTSTCPEDEVVFAHLFAVMVFDDVAPLIAVCVAFVAVATSAEAFGGEPSVVCTA